MTGGQRLSRLAMTEIKDDAGGHRFLASEWHKGDQAGA